VVVYFFCVNRKVISSETSVVVVIEINSAFSTQIRVVK